MNTLLETNMNTLLETIASNLLRLGFVPWFFGVGLQSVAVLAAAGGLCLLLRRAAAATRHWIWFLAVASLPCLMLLAMAPPVWQKPLWGVATDLNSGNQFSLTLTLGPDNERVNAPKPSPPETTAATAVNGTGRRAAEPVTAQFRTTWLALAVIVWLPGAVWGLASVLAGQLQLRRLARSATPLLSETRTAVSQNRLPGNEAAKNTSPPAGEEERGAGDADWALLLKEVGERLRLRRPVRLLLARDNLMPVTWGWWRPVVLLPAEAAEWPAGRRRVVLLHELAHAKRWDCLTQIITRVVCALYWLNPLVWVAARRMSIERERASDDWVLRSGYRASDYAAHLVAIARRFQWQPRLTGIAMARSSQLRGRVAAIVDASRARGLRPATALGIAILMSTIALSVSGRSPAATRSPGEDAALRREQFDRLQSFIRVKEQQVRELSTAVGERIPPEIRRFFAAARREDWRAMTNQVEHLILPYQQHQRGTNPPLEVSRTVYRQPVMEIKLAYDHVANCTPKYTALLADGIISSIPAGSIYFGGTDPGRGVPTAFCQSHAEGNPFFTLTQNALADGTYLDYLRAMYGSKIHLPDYADAQKCFQEYLTDAQQRLKENRLKPGEKVEQVGNHQVRVGGKVAVMCINGLLAKVIFDRNPEREFYLEESFPLDWTYPHLVPHGLILKLNRQPLAQLPEDVLARDHEYWSKLVAGMLGDWLNEKTTVREINDFVDRIYVRKDRQGFSGDPLFIQNDYAGKIFSKLRSSIGGIYAWRLNPDLDVCPAEYHPQSEAERQRLSQEADFAFRQAFALCPYNPEGMLRYAQFLMQMDRFDDALRVAETCLKMGAPDDQLRALIDDIKSRQKRMSE